MVRKWNTKGIFAVEYLSARDADGDPGLELIIEVQLKGESSGSYLHPNDPDNHFYDDRELIRAYLLVHPGNHEIAISDDVAMELYEEFACYCGLDQFIIPREELR